MDQPDGSLQSGAIAEIILLRIKGDLTQLEEEEPWCMDHISVSSMNESEAVGELDQERPDEVGDQGTTAVRTGQELEFGKSQQVKPHERFDEAIQRYLHLPLNRQMGFWFYSLSAK